MENHSVKVETILDLSHFSVGETITGSVYLTTPEPFDDELELVVKKRGTNQDDQTLDTMSLNPVGDNISKEVRKIPFMFVPDDRWTLTDEEIIVIQTVHKNNDNPLLGEVEITYG